MWKCWRVSVSAFEGERVLIGRYHIGNLNVQLNLKGMRKKECKQHTLLFVSTASRARSCAKTQLILGALRAVGAVVIDIETLFCALCNALPWSASNFERFFFKILFNHESNLHLAARLESHPAFGVMQISNTNDDGGLLAQISRTSGKSSSIFRPRSQNYATTHKERFGQPRCCPNTYYLRFRMGHCVNRTCTMNGTKSSFG